MRGLGGAISRCDGSPIHSGSESQGSITVTPGFDTTYTLEVDGRTFRVSVNVNPAVAEPVATPTR